VAQSMMPGDECDGVQYDTEYAPSAAQLEADAIRRECAEPGGVSAQPGDGPRCAKCGYPLSLTWGGYGHAAGYTGRRHVVKVAV
jgi:hypothetical protein